MSMKHGLSYAVIALFAVGCTGPAGVAGPRGSTGATGMTGSQGGAGVTGAQGQAGMTGSQGQTGMTGSQGQTGVTGAQGQPGVAAPASPAPPGTRWTSLSDIMFDYNRTEIRSTELSKIADIAVYTNQNPSVRLGIDGATDLLRGTNQYNAVMSQQRVGNVRDALIRAGVSADRIETGSFGVERAKCNEANEPCSQRDGRVEVMVRPAS
jgi:outer membrane protein OmpA-like peptidoglycan-associated protein